MASLRTKNLEMRNSPVLDRSALAGACVILIVVMATFCSIAGHDFVRWDDEHLYYDPALLHMSWRSVLQAWNPKTVALAYQPVDFMLISAVATVAKLKSPDPLICESGSLLNPHPYHWLSLGLHVVNCLLLYLLLLRYFPRRYLACTIGTLLFGIHPLQVESAAWVSGIDRIVEAFLGFAALHVYTFAVQPGPPRAKLGLYVVAVLLSIVAYLAKPVAITLPLTALVLDVFVLGRDWKTALRWFAPWQFAILPLLLLTGSVSPGQNFHLEPLWTRPFIAGDALTWHIYKLLLPVHLGIDYGRSPHYVLSHWWGYVTWLPAIAVVALTYARRKDRIFVAAVGVWLTALLPVSGLVPFPFQYWSSVADRYSYFALVGPGLACASWLSSSRLKYAAPAASVVLVLLAGLSGAQTMLWQDTPSLMAQARAVNPTTVIGRINIASYYLDHGQPSLAAADCTQALKLDPNNYAALCMLGQAYGRLGRETEATAVLRRAINLHPDDTHGYLYLGTLFDINGKHDDAVVEYRRARTIDPSLVAVDDVAGGMRAKKPYAEAGP